MIKRTGQLFLLICCVFIRTGIAQEMQSKETILTAKTGMSFLVGEIHGGFSGAVNEFNSQPGAYAGMEISRFFTSSLEAGGGVSFSFLRGKTDSPDFSATGYQYFLEVPLSGSFQYSNRLFGPQLFARYHFGSTNSSAPDLAWFLKAGAGILYYKSELYNNTRNENTLLFGKNKGKFEDWKLSNAVFIVGGGFNHKITETILLKIAADFNIVGYDFLDVVHNFDDTGNRRSIIGVFTNLSAGIAFHLKHPEAIRDNPILPFSP